MSSSSTPTLPLYRVPSPGLRPPNTARSPAPPSAISSSLTSTYALISPHETAARLSTSLTHGLSPADADVRLAKNGPNELPHEDPEPLWLRFLKQFKETLILLLLGSAAISFFMGNLDDAISITIAVTIVVTVGFVQEYRSEQSLEALSRLVPHSAHLIRGKPSSASTGTPNSTNGGLESGQVTPVGESPAAFAAAEKASSTVQATQLVVGDLVLFSTGDRIPADLRITQSVDLTIDESNLTGENEPVAKSPATLESKSASASTSASTRASSPFYAGPAAGTVGADVRLNEQTNIAFMGTLVRSGYGRGIVVASGADTEFGSIHASLQEIESPRTPLQLSMDRLGQELSYMSFAVIGFIVIVGLWQGRKLLEMFQIGVSLAVAAIPEGLPIIVTVTLALGVLRMANHHAIVRRLPSVETLGSVNVVCSDKTGTLTLNHMTVTKIWHSDVEDPIDLTKELVSSAPDTAMRTLLRIGNIANNARLSKSSSDSPATASSAAVLSSTLDHGSSDSGQRSRWVGQPTDVAMLDLVDAFGEDDVRERLGERACETPFSSERKWMGVVINGSATAETPTANSSDVAYIKGALEEVLKRCDSYLTKEGREIILDEPRRRAALEASEQMAQEGLRVLGFASGPVRDVARANPKNKKFKNTKGGSKDDGPFHGLVFAGIVGMNDPPRKDVDKSIRRLMAGGVKVIMITGDSETTAVAIAKKLGMHVGTSRGPYKPVLRGDELDRMSEEELAQAIPGASIFARTSPDHKLKIVRAFQARGDVVAMTGDGVNDAPALKKADIGISMGLLGTDVAKEAADMILTDDDFSTILSAIEEGKGIFYNIQNFLTFQLSTSVAALSLVLLSTFLGFKNPLNAMQILWINILMDGPPAQSLGVEPVDPAVMTRPPRAKGARVLTKQVIHRVLTSATIIMIGTMMVYVMEMSSNGVVSARDTTMTFTCFVLFDMFNALTCRSQGKSILRGEIAPFGNKMFNIAVAGSLGGQLAVVYLPFLQTIFQTEALGFRDLLWLVMVASSVFWVDEIRKWVRTRSNRGTWGYSFSV
ncbi:secretory pathway Ca2+-ATPase [Xylona heveae TC161]|uniref:P-type Ca(2+) transporter n=1 Tax=Xylona heveae (strain CBS 132557 / TC161) TaxID=1328760 RepID=A0A165GLV2_XYLHT|nr:secretory pathway Ca2+-ATPase [Xylona heveae TC161]KZF22351.1 secretory pathway Ca2+-ATPase [Xylona heveae TC161]